MKTTTNKCPVCHWEIKDGGKTVKISGQSIVQRNQAFGETQLVKQEASHYLFGFALVHIH